MEKQVVEVYAFNGKYAEHIKANTGGEKALKLEDVPFSPWQFTESADA